MAAAVLLPFHASPAGEAIAACKDAKRYPTRREKGECLEKTRDVAAIPELYGLARELVMANGRRGLADEDFRYLASFAGEVATWTDHRFLVEKARSADVYDQYFAVEALKHMLLELYLGPRGTVEERVARFKALRADTKRACEPLLASNEMLLSDLAKDCVEVAEDEPPKRAGRIDLPPTKPERSICLRDAFGPRIELCIKENPEIKDALFVEAKLHPAPYKKGWEREPEPGVDWLDDRRLSLELRGHKVLSQVRVELEPREGIPERTPRTHFLRDSLVLVFVPVVRGREGAFDSARAVLALFDLSELVFISVWQSPPCKGGCKMPRFENRGGRSGTKFEVHLDSAKSKSMHRVVLSEQQLRPAAAE